jgi:hypothetical protein
MRQRCLGDFLGRATGIEPVSKTLESSERGSGGVKIWAESANELSPWTKPRGQVKFASLRRFASPSLWGEFGGLHACRAIFQYIVPPPNIFLTRLFSKTRLKRNDFQEVARLAWAQEAPGSNPGAPTKNISRVFFCLFKAPFTSNPLCGILTDRRSQFASLLVSESSPHDEFAKT